MASGTSMAGARAQPSPVRVAGGRRVGVGHGGVRVQAELPVHRAGRLREAGPPRLDLGEVALLRRVEDTILIRDSRGYLVLNL